MYMVLFFQAAVICGCIGIVAETSYEALKKRFDQGWVLEMIDDVETLITRVIKAKKNKEVNPKSKIEKENPFRFFYEGFPTAYSMQN